MCGTLGHFKNTEVLVLYAALEFSHYLVHLVPIGTILSKIAQYLDLPQRLSSFRVSMHGRVKNSECENNNKWGPKRC